MGLRPPNSPNPNFIRHERSNPWRHHNKNQRNQRVLALKYIRMYLSKAYHILNIHPFHYNTKHHLRGHMSMCRQGRAKSYPQWGLYGSSFFKSIYWMLKLICNLGILRPGNTFSSLPHFYGSSWPVFVVWHCAFLLLEWHQGVLMPQGLFLFCKRFLVDDLCRVMSKWMPESRFPSRIFHYSEMMKVITSAVSSFNVVAYQYI